MPCFLDGPLAGKTLDSATSPRYIEGPWAGRYELARTAKVSGATVYIAENYRFDQSYVPVLPAEIIWITD